MATAHTLPRGLRTTFSTFHPFPRLPIEIRHMIWEHAASKRRIVYLQQIRRCEERCQRKEGPLQLEDDLDITFDLRFETDGDDWDTSPSELPDQDPDRIWGEPIPEGGHAEDQLCDHRTARYCTGFTSSTKIALLYVCREAYQIASGATELSFGTKRNAPTTRFNFDKDTLYLDWKDDDPININNICKLLDPDIKKVKNVAFGFNCYGITRRSRDQWLDGRFIDPLDWNLFITILQWFENVQQVTLVNNDSSCVIGYDDLVWTDPRYTKEILGIFSTKRYCPIRDVLVRDSEQSSRLWKWRLDELLEDMERPPFRRDDRVLGRPLPNIQCKTLMTGRNNDEFERAKIRWQRDARIGGPYTCNHQQCQDGEKLPLVRVDPFPETLFSESSLNSRW